MTEALPPKPALDAADYQLEVPLECHHCGRVITTVQVIRLLRTKVNFVSTLPRRGHVLICPECHGILSAELGGMT